MAAHPAHHMAHPSSAGNAATTAAAHGAHALIARLEAAASAATTLPAGSDVRQRIALLLCFPDRYGAGKYRGPHRKLFAAIRAQHRLLRREIAARGIERVQLQFPRLGASLLSITAPRAWRAELDQLVVWACRHLYGADMAARPFMLPKKLQPKQPILPVRSVPATKINTLLRDLFRARRRVAASSSASIAAATAVQVEGHDVVALVRAHASFIDGLGLPSAFTSDMHYRTFVPKVTPNRQIILWRRWHATAGAKDASAKMTSFVDVMPADQLSEQSRVWYEYWARHAPCDPGGGSSRGAWPSYVVKYRRWVAAGRPREFQWGVSPTLPWVCQGAPGLSAEQLETFKRKGYLVLDVPEATARRTEHAAAEFEQWFRVFSGVQDFTFATHTTDLFAPIKPPPKGNDYRYMTDKMDTTDPFNPNATSGKSHNPQAGGKMIAKDSGMGPGSTFCDAPSHLAFQFSDWITNIFSSFYGPVPLVRVLERFRIKQQSAWGAAHVDVDPERMHEHPSVAAATANAHDAEEPSPRKRVKH